MSRDYNLIAARYHKNDMIQSLNDNQVKKYSGSLTLVGIGKNRVGYDSNNHDLIVYKYRKYAKVIEKGVDYDMKHIENVLNTCKRLRCSTSELLRMDYMTELGYNK